MQRLAGEQALSLGEAMDLVKEDDKQRNDLFSTYYDVRWDDPELYAISLNTGVVTMETATEVLLRIVEQLKGAG